MADKPDSRELESEREEYEAPTLVVLDRLFDATLQTLKISGGTDGVSDFKNSPGSSGLGL